MKYSYDTKTGLVEPLGLPKKVGLQVFDTEKAALQAAVDHLDCAREAACARLRMLLPRLRALRLEEGIATGATAYDVEIIENNTENRNLTVPATSSAEAACAAYRWYVEDGMLAPFEYSISVDTRTFQVACPDGTIEEFDNAEAENGAEEAED